MHQKIYLKRILDIFNRVQIETFWWSCPPEDILLFKKILGVSAGMLRIIVLLKMVESREHIFNKWY